MREMSAKVFLDTNIFAYSFDRRDPSKRDVALELIQKTSESKKARISYQVVQEFVNVATKKFNTPLKSSDARMYVESIMMPMWHVNSSPGLTIKALDIQERWSYSFYDSLIIASAIEAGCSILYSEDLQHGQTIEGLKIINPFL
jgi:predicted nucleic acid-binding protein